MHSQGIGGLSIQRMQLLEDNSKRIGGIDLFKEIGIVRH
jgi:hypothetical protein